LISAREVSAWEVKEPQDETATGNQSNQQEPFHRPGTIRLPGCAPVNLELLKQLSFIRVFIRAERFVTQDGFLPGVSTLQSLAKHRRFVDRSDGSAEKSVRLVLRRTELATRSARILNDIGEISAREWDACANPQGRSFNPFLSHAFLHALEASGSATSRTGWQPFHLLLEEDEKVLGAVPMYLKGHSQGEYVFDYSWADAFHRAGGDYYPKLQASVPFTPASGRRVLARDGSSETEEALFGACVQVADQVKVSSLHLTFLPEEQWQIAGKMGFLQRMDQQYHWHNAGYSCFTDFLADLSSKKRKNLKRERRDANTNGITIEWVTGSDLTEAHWDAFYRFYTDTGSRKWGSPYLTREFFSLISASMPQDILLIMCKRNDRYIAGALNFIGSDTLFGRNWGCLEHHRFLHFETCYYQAIDFAIDRGLKKVEAGAQGQHKVARGYLPEATYSAHWIGDPGFRRAVDNYLSEEREHVAQDIEWIEQHSPFKSGVDLSSVRTGSIDLS
jgi:predicted N-acyltransferase